MPRPAPLAPGSGLRALTFSHEEGTMHPAQLTSGLPLPISPTFSLSSQHRLLNKQGLSSVLPAGFRCLLNCQCHSIKRQHSAFMTGLTS